MLINDRYEEWFDFLKRLIINGKNLPMYSERGSKIGYNVYWFGGKPNKSGRNVFPGFEKIIKDGKIGKKKRHVATHGYIYNYEE